MQLNLNTAFQNFFNKRARYPKFKKKSDHHDSYTTNVVNGNISYRTSDKYMYVTLPKIPGELMVKNHRPVKQGGKLKSVTVSREPSGKYYISLLFEYTKVKAVHDIDPDNAIGLDMSMRSFYVDSDGNEVDSPHAYLHVQDRLAREQRKLSHMKKGSSNYQKQKLKVAKLHAKATYQRNDFLHKLSRKLVDAYDIVGIEDLDMKGMSQALNFGKSISGAGSRVCLFTKRKLVESVSSKLISGFLLLRCAMNVAVSVRKLRTCLLENGHVRIVVQHIIVTIMRLSTSKTKQ